MLRAITLTILFSITLLLVSCGQNTNNNSRTDQPAGSNPPENTAVGESASDKYQAAETLARRAILYKLAFQEGDLAPFTAMPEAIESMNLPVLPVELNKMWWTMKWETASLAPLPSTVITGLEPVIFPLIGGKLVEADDENGWAMFALAYDPDLIKILIANAHTEWQPEEREVYLSGILEGCLQIWCVKINGEWKLLAHLPCQDDVEAPEVPEIPAELFAVSAGETEPVN